jgi:hypothetical protein
MQGGWGGVGGGEGGWGEGLGNLWSEFPGGEGGEETGKLTNTEINNTREKAQKQTRSIQTTKKQ